MEILQKILEFLDIQINTPSMYGLFHVAFLVLSVVAGIVLCVLWNKGIIKNIRMVLLVTSISLIILEMYRQISLSIGLDGGITFEFHWDKFPWQLYSVPMYVGLIAGLTKGRAHDYLCSHIATFGLMSAVFSMLYPVDLFSTALGLNIQIMILLGAVIAISILLYYTHYVDISFKSLFRGLPVFAVSISTALILNELAHLFGLTKNYPVSMFGISAHVPSTTPVYGGIHNWLMGKGSNFYILCLFIFFIGCVLCTAAVVYGVILINKIVTTDYNEQYAIMDERRREKMLQRQEKLRLLEERRRQELKEAREKRKEERKEKRERREAEREAKIEQMRDERKRERARRKKERRERRKELAKRKREERARKLKEKRLAKKQERKEEDRLKAKMKEIEKREKKEKKALKKAKKEEKRRLKLEKKAYKKWLKVQKKLGVEDPDIEMFYDEYYD